MPFAGGAAPVNFLMCNGAAYNSVANPELAPLYAVIGTTYGGTGATNFNVPDIRGATIVGVDGATFGSLGTQVGNESRTLTTNNMPSHNHPGSSTDFEPNHSHGGVPSAYNGNQGTGGSNAARDPGGTTFGAGGHSHTLTIAAQGSGTSFGIIQPSIALNYIISIG